VVEHFFQDIRFGARILTRAPGLSAAAVLLIALVIGGNATVYSMINSMLVSPAPGVSRRDLVVIRHVDPAASLTDPFVSFPNFEDYARQSKTISNLTAWVTERLTLGTPAGNFAFSGGLVTTNYFDAFGVALTRGRIFTPQDDAARDGMAVIISHRIWQERFDLAESIVGTQITINQVQATVVGVAPQGFVGATLTPGEELWIPIRAFYRSTKGESELTNRAQPSVLMAGRLNEAHSLEQARAEFNTLCTQLQHTYPNAFTTFSPKGVVPLQNARPLVSRYSATALLPIADIAPVFLAVFSVVTLLTLIIVCANVANLLLGRAVERQRDTAVRLALGASRGRILRLQLAEGATLSVAAAITAYMFALWASGALLRIIEPRPGLLAHARPDWTLGAYALGLAFVSTAVFSLAPSLRSWRVPISPSLKAGETGIARGRSRWSTSLVIVQFAFSVLLVTSAGLAYRSMTRLSSVDLGFEQNNLLLVTVRLGDTYGERGFAILERVRERLASVPGVEAASYTRRIPGATILIQTPIKRDAQRGTTGYVRQVGPGYLQTIGLNPVAGRALADTDRRGATRVAMINRRLATDLFGSEPAIGQQLSVGERERIEVIGVVPDALVDGPSRDPNPRYLFVAEQQTPGNPPTDPSFILRYRGALDAMTIAVTRAIGQDESLPVVSISTMTSRLALVTELETQVVKLLACFASLSLVIAAFGHYAVAMFNMRRRTREFGVRMALGASAERIQAAVVGEALTHAGVGLMIGLAISAGVAIGFRTLLFGVTPIDPMTYAGVIGVLVVTSTAASYLPARRASRVNVVDALRQD
jgi:predicted permease